MKSSQWSLPKPGDKRRARRIAAAREVWVLEPFSFPGVPRTRVPRYGVRSHLLSWIRASDVDVNVGPKGELGDLSHAELVELDRALMVTLERTLGERLPDSLVGPTPTEPNAPVPKEARRVINKLHREILAAAAKAGDGVARLVPTTEEKKLLLTALELTWHRSRPRREPPADDPSGETPPEAGSAPGEDAYGAGSSPETSPPAEVEGE